MHFPSLPLINVFFSGCPFPPFFLSSMVFLQLPFLLSYSHHCSSSSVCYLLFFLYLPIFPCSLNLFLFPCYLYSSFISLASPAISYSYSISLLSVYVPQVQDYRGSLISRREVQRWGFSKPPTIAFARKHTYFLSFSLPIFALSIIVFPYAFLFLSSRT